MKIVSLPDKGVLKHGGAQILPAALPKTVTMADLDGANPLTYTPPAGESGNDLASFTFKVNDGLVDSADTYTMTIDVVTAAALAGVEVTSVPRRWSNGSGNTASVRDTYGAGERIAFVATFDSGVTVTGEPHLVFALGDTRKNAAYDASLSAAAGHGKMVFTYPVRSEDSDNDGIGLLDSSDSGLANGAIVLGAGEFITSGNGAGASSLVLAGFKGTQSGHRVAGSRTGPHPVSLEVTSTPPRARDTYRKGDVVELTLTMSEPVLVIGTPHLEFEVGSFDRDAAYDRAKSQSSRTELVFAYTIASGEEDDDGIFVKDGRDFTGSDSSVVLEAGETIRARVGDAYADLVHPGRGRRSGHKVDAVAPTVDSLAIRGTSLEIAFAEELGAAASLTNAPFTVKKTPQGGSAEDVTLTGAPVIGGRTVTLTLAASVELGYAVTVRYDKPDTGSDNKLVDVIGNEVDDFEQTIEQVPNVPAQGRPEISGTSEVGQTLTATLGTVTDTDGVPDAADLAWQWVRVDGETETAIDDATGTSYTLTAEDAYKQVRVRVSFTDASGSPETRPSAPTVAIIGACDEPSLGDRSLVWRGELTAANLGGNTHFGYRQASHGVAGTLAGDGNMFSLTRKYTIVNLLDRPPSLDDLHFSLPHNTSLGRRERMALQLHVCERMFAFSAARETGFNYGGLNTETYVWSAPRMRWRSGLTRTLRLSLPANTEATGAPAIVPPIAFRVPATLSVDLSGIDDADGGGFAERTTYNWQRVDAAHGTVVADGIGTGPTYTLTSGDVGSRIRVEVRFTDAVGNSEGPLASEAVPAAGTVTAAAPCIAPTYVGGAEQIGAARTLTVGLETLSGTHWYGFSADAGGLGGAGFAVGSNAYEIRHARVSASGTLSVKLDRNLTAADRSSLGLHVCGTAFTFASAAGAGGDHVYTWSASGLDWSGHSERTLYLSRDAAAPHVVSIERQDPASSPTNADTLTWRVSFSEAVTGVDAADFEVSGTAAALSVDAVPDLPAAWDVTASGGDLADLDATVALAFASSHAITDSFGNGLANTVPTNTNESSYAVDNTAPSLVDPGGATVHGPRLVLTFDEDLVDTASLTNARFTATKAPPGGSAEDVALTGTPAISGRTVTLTLGAAPAATDRVTVSYRKPDSGTGNRLVDKAGNEVDALETSTAGGADAPRSLAARVGDTRVRLVWEAPADDGGGSITGYQYRHAARSTVPDTTGWTAVPHSGSTTVLIDGLANGTARAFEVRAVNRTGAGAVARATATPAALSCAAPDLGTRREVWSGTLTVGLERFFLSSEGLLDAGYANQAVSGSGSLGALSDRNLSIGATDYTISEIVAALGPDGNRGNTAMRIGSRAFTDAVKVALRFHSCDETANLADATSHDFPNLVLYQWDTGSLDWSLYRTLELAFSLPANRDASGKPAISGTAAVGETLSAARGTVADVDGVPGGRADAFAWQWVRVDADGASNPTDIENATSSTYVLTPEDLGKRVKVRVSFTDLLGGNETRESAAYPASGTVDNASGPVVTIAAGDEVETEGESAGFTLTLSEPAPEGGLAVGVTVEEVERRDRSAGGADEGELPYDFVAAGEEGVNAVSFAAGATSATLTVPTVADSLYEAGAGATNLLRATVTTGSGYRLGATTAAELDLGEGGEQPVVSFRDAADGLTVDEDAGDVEVVAELTEAYAHRAPLHLSFIASSAGVNDFDDPGAGGSAPTYWFDPGISETSVTVQITDDPVLEDTEDFSLRILASSTPTISEDAGEITISITDDDEAQLDISASDIPGTATGEVIEGGNIEIHVGPARSGATGDCDIPFAWYAEIAPAGDTAALADAASQSVRIIPCGTGTATFATVDDAAVTADRSVRFSIARVGLDDAFATTDGRLLLPASNEVTLTVREDEATGAPAISAPGGFRVPAVLSVDLSGIMDADGVADIAAGAAYEWQRLSAGGATVEADSIGTSATYTLAPADVGRKLRVQVSFTDDAGNAEGPLASVAVPSGTDTVEAGLTVGFGEHQGRLEEGDSVDVPVVLSGPPGREVTIELTADRTHGLSDSDVATGSLSLTFGSQDTRKTVTVSAVDDSVADPGEVLVLNLPAAADLPPEITATDTDTSVRIVDNDFDYRVSHAGGTALDVAEGAGTLTATVRADTPESVDSDDLTELDETVTLSASTQDGTATAGEDYTAVTGVTLTFGAADFVETASCSCLRAEKTVSISITDDTVDEDDTAETFTLALSHESGQRVDYGEAGAAATVSITDDDAAGTLALTLDTIAGDNTINIAEKAAGFAVSGDTGSVGDVSVTVSVGGTHLTATSSTSDPATWSVSVPAAAAYITGPSVEVSVTASKTGYTSPAAVTRTLTVDLVAPTAPAYTAPGSLTVGEAITAMSPAGGAGIDEYSATGLPSGLSIDPGTGEISGTPEAAGAAATATVTGSDAAGNADTVDIAFPAVAKGDQTLSGFGYSASSVMFGEAAPAVTAPSGAQGALSYAAAPAAVCTVDDATGALTLEGAGSCEVTVTAASTANYDEATATYTVEVQAAGTLVLTLDTIAGDDTINIAEKAAGFVIEGNTGSVGDVSVTVSVGGTNLTATSSTSNPAIWSVMVPAAAAYITGPSVAVEVTASKTGYTSPAAATRTLTVDLVAPAAPAYTAPGSLTVGEAITAMSPAGGAGIDEYSATGLPSGLSIDPGTGEISGTPEAAGAAATATVTGSDAAGNTDTVDIAFPAVAKGEQTLSGFGYSASSVMFGEAAPAVTAPSGAQGALSYAAAPAAVCTVDAASGALALEGAGSCEVTVTAASTANYDEATATYTVEVQAAGTLALTLDTIAGDDTINIAEKAAGFVIEGNTGSVGDVSVTVSVGGTNLTATSSTSNPAIWSVMVPAAAAYITGPSVAVEVTASKTGYTSPAAATRTLTVDLVAPAAPAYTAPGSLTVGEAITAMSPAGGAGIDEYSATGLPSGLSIDPGTGEISGTPEAAGAAATATVTGSDAAGNTDTVDIAFPAVAKGEQTLSGFGYSASSVMFGEAAPAVTAPSGAQGALSYAAAPAAVCTVDAASGALALEGAGSCEVTVTAASTANYDEATATYTVEVQAAGTLALTLDTIAGDDTINIAEKAAGFVIEGNTGSVGDVSVTVSVGGTNLTATSSTSDPATWSVSVPAAAAYITSTSVAVSVTAAKAGYTSPAAVTRTLTVDLEAPAAPTYTAPGSLTVGEAITAMSPAGGAGIDEYSATGLPSGLSIDPGTGEISGTPEAAGAAATATVTGSDAAGNADTVDIAFPAVAKGEQTLSGFGYSASSVMFGEAAPTVTAPSGAQGALSYAAAPAAVCTVDAATGALTLEGVGSCEVTATAASTANYDEATATYTVEVQAAGTLALTLDTIAGDDTINIAEKAAGFVIEGNTGSVGDVSVTVSVGGTNLTATSSTSNPATWSVSVPTAAAYITGPSVAVEVTASKTGYTSPAAATRTLTVDLVAPAAPAYTAPGSLTVGEAITAMSPAGGAGIDEYSATGLPSGLSIDPGTGEISGTPEAAGAAATATVTGSDAAGNTDTVDIAFPAVAKGDQTLSGFGYSPSSLTFGDADPTLSGPTGAKTTLSYAASPAEVCTVDDATGALTIVGAGSCEVTATAEGTDSYNAATATVTVAVAAANAPTRLQARHSDARYVTDGVDLQLAWAPPSATGMESITHYQYRYSTGATLSGSPAWVDVPLGYRTVTVHNLANSTQYTFEVRAVYGMAPGTPGTAATLTVTTVVPRPRLGGIYPKESSGDTMIDLSWSAIATLGGEAVTGYRIEESSDGRTWNQLVADTGNVLTYRRTGLTRGEGRYYRIQALSATKTGAYSERAWASTRPPAPGKPVTVLTEIRELGLTGYHTLSWDPVEDRRGLIILDYEFRYPAKPKNLVVRRHVRVHGDGRHYIRFPEVTTTVTQAVTSPAVSFSDLKNIRVRATISTATFIDDARVIRTVHGPWSDAPQVADGTTGADDAASALSGASVDGAALTLTFGEALDEGSAPPGSSFAVTVAGAARIVDSAAVSGSVVTLTLTSAVTAGETVTVGYTVPTGADAKPVRDAAGNPAAAFADAPVTNATAAALPVVSIAPGATPVTEGTAAAFALARTGATAAALTVAVSVGQAGSVLDGPPPSSATFEAGASQARLSVATTNDGAHEADARVRASVVAGEGYAVDGENALAGVDVLDDDAAPQVAAAVAELWSTTLVWADLGHGWYGGFADAFSAPGWSEDGQAYRIWYIAYDTGARELLMAHDGSGGLIGEPGELSLHVGGLALGPGEALSEFARAGVGTLGGVDSQWPVGERVTVRLTRTAGDAQAPPAGSALSVADARVNESSGAPLRFRVTLDAPAQSTVSVRYRTSDGTARAGEDYAAAHGVVRFAPGETTKTVEVAVLPDSHDEGAETMTLTLSRPYGATLAGGAATGTISNTGPIPKAWIARFGRTVAEQAIDAVEARFAAPREAGFAGTLAGQPLGGFAEDPAPVDAQGEDTREGLETIAEWLDGTAEEDDEDGLGARTMSGREVLATSTFSLTQGAAESGFASFWGRGVVTRFDGRDGERTLDGEVASAMVGADWSRDALLGGLMVSHSRGEGSYRDGSGAGTVESTLTALFPYARYALTERVSAWGMAGYGEGTLTVTPEGQAALRPDLSFLMGALGVRGVLLDGGHDGATLAAKSDAFAVRTSTGAVSGRAGNLKASRADVTRVRFALEGSRPVRLGESAVLTPSLELGVRHDGGDAETGFGADLGAGLALSDPARGLSAELRARGLLTHEAQGMRERSVSGTLIFDPAPETERGLSVSLTQTVGAQSAGGAEALLERQSLAGLGAQDDDELSARRLDARIGYGFGVLDDRFTAVPELGLGLSDTDREVRLGWRLAERVAAGLAFELGVEGTRREWSDGEAGPQHGIGIGAGWRLVGASASRFGVRDAHRGGAPRRRQRRQPAGGPHRAQRDRALVRRRGRAPCPPMRGSALRGTGAHKVPRIR